VGRPEKQLDPAGGAVQRFTGELRNLRVMAGRPTYRQLAASAHYSHTTLSRAAAGDKLPSLPVALAFAAACGGDPGTWTRRWHEAAGGQRPGGPDGRHHGGGPAAASLRSRLEAREDSTYVGRQAEIGRVLALLSDRAELPRVVSVHGPPGIGKTAFACAASRAWSAGGGGPAVIIDSRDFSHDPGGLDAVVRQRCQPWPRTVGAPPLLLVIDTYEEMAGAALGPRHEFIRQLRGPVLVMAAGRRPASGLLQPPGWRSLVEEIELGGLSRAESGVLLGRLGVARAPDLQAALAFAQGSPLMLTIAAELARAGRDCELAGACRAPGISRHLITVMTRDIRDPGVRRLLEAASIVRTANQELLAAIVRADVSAEFTALCELSVVRIVEQGIRVHDVVRQAIAADLRWRSPATYDAWRQRACRYLRETSTSTSQQWQLQELLYLLHDPAHPAATVTPWMALDAHAAGPDTQIRPVADGELPAVLALCRRGQSLEGVPPELCLREVSAGPALHAGTCMLALDEDKRPVAVSYALPLTAGNWPSVAAARPAWRRALPAAEIAGIERAAPGSPAAVLYGQTIHLPGHRDLAAAAGREVFIRCCTRFPRLRRSYVLMTPDCPVTRYAEWGGFRPRMTGIELGGAGVDEWICDYGPGGWADWAQRAIRLAPGRSRTSQDAAQALPESARERMAQNSAVPPKDRMHPEVAISPVPAMKVIPACWDS
jgi:hypothetical protein